MALEFGSALHAGLNTALEAQDADSAMDTFEAYWDTCQDGLDYKGERFSKEIYADMGRRFVANFHKRYASKMKLIVGEKRMHGVYKDPYTLEGTPDALVEYNGQNVLLDFKSSGYPYAAEKIDVSLQLNLYAWLLEENGYKVDAIAYAVFVKSNGSISTLKPIPYDKEKALQMIGDMVKYFVRNGNSFERNPNACIMGKIVCPYLEKCYVKSKERSSETVLETPSEAETSLHSGVRI